MVLNSGFIYWYSSMRTVLGIMERREDKYIVCGLCILILSLIIYIVYNIYIIDVNDISDDILQDNVLSNDIVSAYNSVDTELLRGSKGSKGSKGISEEEEQKKKEIDVSVASKMCGLNGSVYYNGQNVGNSTNGTTTYNGDGSEGKFKAYMDKDKITAKGTKQYELKNMATIDENGTLSIGGRLLIAIGTGHEAPVGTNVDVILESGQIIKCMVGDIKSDRDTDVTHKVCIHDKSIIEFIVVTNLIDNKAKQMGDMSYAGYYGGVTKVIRY